MSRRTTPLPISEDERRRLKGIEAARKKGGPPKGKKPNYRWKQPYLPMKARKNPVVKKLAGGTGEDGEQEEKMPVLNELDLKFVLEYLRTGALGKSYRAAFDPENKLDEMTLSWKAWSRIRLPRIQAHINKAIQAQHALAAATLHERQNILTQMARGQVVDFLDLSNPGEPTIKITPESPNLRSIRKVSTRRSYDRNGSLVSVDTDFQLADPVKAIDVMNRMDGIYSDDKNKDGPANTQIVLNINGAERGF